MKFQPSILIAFLATIVLISACKKDDPPTGTSPVITSQFSDIREFLENEAPQTQTFAVNAQFPVAIRTEYGSTIKFSPNAFQDAQGNIVTGNIDVQVTEYMNRAEMILGAKPTMSNGEILISGGQFNIEAFQNGVELEASPQYSLEMSVPTNDPDPQMTLFTGEEDPDGFVDWQQDNQNEFWYMENDSSFNSSCGYLYGSVEVPAGETLIVTYNDGIEPSTEHSVYIYSQCSEFNFTGSTLDGELLNASSTEDCVVTFTLSDLWYDGWEDASITIQMGEQTMEVSLPSDDCEPVPFTYVYQLYTNHLGWINCDYFWNTTDPQVTIYAVYPDGFDCDNTVCYLVFPDELSVANMNCSGIVDGTEFSNIPDGIEAVICALSYDPDSETFYSAYAPITVSADLETELTFSETTVQAFEAYINGL